MTNTGSIERKTFAGLLIALITLAIMSYVAVQAILAREESTQRFTTAQQALLVISELHADVGEVATTQDSFVATGNRGLLPSRANAVKRLNATLREAGDLFQSSPGLQQRFVEVQKKMSEELRLLDMAQEQFLSAGLSGYSNARLQAQATMNEINVLLGAMVNEEETLIRDVKALGKRSSQMLYLSVFIVLGLALAALLWLTWHVQADLLARRRSETLLREANAELEHRAQQLKLSNQELESFCYSVSHDLRTPLRTMDGFAQVLEDEYQQALGAHGLRYLQTIRSASKRMGQLIDDLLMYSKLGRQTVQPVSLDMTSLANKAAELVMYGRAIQPSLEIQPLVPAYGDEGMLNSVWTNLIDNAIKYSSKNPAPAIQIKCVTDQQQAVYSVHDNGVGFDMKYYDKLFGVFKRLHANADFPGTGVGLAIVERIVNRHGGRVWAESAPNAGATFISPCR